MPNESAAFFSISGLAKHFGGIHAVEDLSFALRRGEILGLIGPNGSGKTTTLNMVTGALKPDGGRIEVDGTDMAGQPAHLYARRGIARTFQVPRLFRRMTVMENLIVPALSDASERRRTAEEHARGVLAFLRLEHLADQYARALSGGQQKLLELGRALMLRPHLLLLDEPFAGVHPRLLDEIVEHIRSLNRDGHTIVLVDHNLDAVRSVVTRVLVMARGRKIADGAVSDVLRNPEVVRAYTGTRMGGS
ncbi:ABC transporter ATP-binding protein [Labrys sp. LIt4]|uniref:ABC transporter ATP-binding protein n=1 Tax=Labrys sp. LIt4 TaxID=2821355 RepID=UPI001ADEDA8A|nr:ABC transporter ATP-binding protein [Labrys sp. LIt4]MBP0580402.1 ABC transporter ATP-binding protein [Labrys sp. LIt4]